MSSSTWKPTEKQERFLQSPHFEVLYGGAPGSGKTDALLVDACGLNQSPKPAILYPKYFAVMIRPTMPELREVIERTRTLYPAIDPGAIYNAGTNTWRFSSGARIAFTYMKEERDVDKFKSQEIQYIGWEELTLHPTPYGYNYLLTRVRKSDKELEPIQMYVRATTNPDGPGHAWVKAHWRIPDNGSSTLFEIEHEITDKKNGGKKKVTTSRQFISATLRDNPYIDDDYEAKIRLSGEGNVGALVEGRWDIVKIEGAYYQKQCQKVISEGRICKLPWCESEPTYTAWDLGASDYTSIWVMQKDGPWLNFLTFYQNHGFGIEHYLKWVRGLGLNLSTFYLPHDAVHKRQGILGTETLVDMFLRCGVYDIQVVKKIDKIHTGIEMTRQMLDKCRFDKEGTAEGWTCLTNYRATSNPRTHTFAPKPRHDIYSHGADAIRMFAQAGLNEYTDTAPIRRNNRALPKGMRAKSRKGKNTSVV